MKYAGIDVSKDRLDCKVEALEGAKGFQNTAKGFVRLAKWLKKQEVTQIILESTGGYERAAFNYLSAAELPTTLLNPRQSKAFAKALSKHAKNDIIDAEVLMLFGARMNPEPTEPLSDTVVELRECIRRRKQLIKMATDEKNRLQAPGDQFDYKTECQGDTQNPSKPDKEARYSDREAYY